MRKGLRAFLLGCLLAAGSLASDQGQECLSIRYTPLSNGKGAPPKDLTELDLEETVRSTTETLTLVQGVAAWMNENLGMRVDSQPWIHVRPSIAGGVQGETEFSPTFGAYRPNEDGGELSIKTGLSRGRLIQIIAHEWTHVWQAEHCPTGQDLLVHEGFAQWAASRILESLELEEDLESLKNRTDFYGEAYRWVAEFERRNGREALMQRVMEREVGIPPMERVRN